jgi:hypothetical protein
MMHLLSVYLPKKTRSMRPRLWRPPIELSGLEQSIVKRIKKAKLFTFLRMERHELFNESFQEQLAKMYADQPQGHPLPPDACASCPLRERCTSSVRGRTVSIHADERLLQELRERQLTPQGRTKLRERVAVEHCLSHIGRWQGDRARYVGLRKNLFDLRRTAVVHNLHVIAQIVAQSQDQQPSYLTPLVASGQLATI